MIFGSFIEGFSLNVSQNPVQIGVSAKYGQFQYKKFAGEPEKAFV